MTLVAGIDSSTQSCKVVIRDADTGALVREGRSSHPAGTEVDPAAWWTALLEAIDAAGGLTDVAAVSVAAQQHGMVALDSDGQVIRPALLWNDTRSAGAATDLIAEFGAAELAERTGCVPVASFTITKLRWLRDAEAANAADVAAVALPHDWLTWRLRGFGPADDSPLGADLDELTTDRSDASGTGYWSPGSESYDRELFIAALGHDAVLPRVLGPGESAGTGVAGGPVGPDTVIGPGAGDNAGAALGLGASAGDVVVSIGTSGTVFAVTPTAVRDASGTVAGFASADGAFLPLIATLNAARILDSVASLLGVDHEELGRLALAAPAGARGLVLQPYFEGERTPNLPDATATLFGMSLESTTRDGLARAAIEGLLCGLADGLDAVLSQGVVAQRVLLIGGAAQNPAVQAIAREVFSVPVVVPAPGEYVADGGAVQAAWALTGVRPSWPVEGTGDAAPSHADSGSGVARAQYAARRA
ncbi:xylulose kinase [Plantibacter flavus]|uniref:xylulokinase n=1 Tax=Plantibacter flavus TaxID=150123 RepID=UPI003F14CFBA